MSKDARKEELRAKLKAKAEKSKQESIDRLTQIRDEMLKKHAQGRVALGKDQAQQALTLFLECKASLTMILKFTYIKSFDPQFINDLFGDIFSCCASLKKWNQCYDIAREACQLNATAPIENLAELCYSKNECEAAYQLLQIVYQSKKKIDSAKSLRTLGALLYNGYGQVKKNQRYTLAVQLLEEALKKGNKNAYYDLGIFYHHCELKQFRNRSKAIENYTKVAQLGDTRAHNRLGSLYAYEDQDNPAIGPDYLMALFHFKQAAKANLDSAYFNLAMIYDVRLNKPQKAIPWYEKAIDVCQCAKSMHNLAIIHENGEGTPVNPGLALSLFCRASDLGHVPSMFSAANMMMMTNTGVVPDPIKAEKYLRMASEADDARSNYFLALYIYEKRFASEKRLQEYMFFLLRAATLGIVEAMLNYAVVRDKILDEYNREVHQWLEKAAAKDFIHAQVNLMLYLVKYSTQLVESHCFTPDQLIDKITDILKKNSQSSNEIEANLALRQLKLIEQTDRVLSRVVEVFSKSKARAPSTLEQELETISSEQRKSRQQRMAGILSRVRNTAWVNIENLASALYYVGKVFDENSSTRDPFEENKAGIINIIKVVTQNIDKLSHDSLVNIFIGLSKLHLHPDNVMMASCLQHLLPKLLEILEETIFVSKRKLLYATTRFLFSCHHPAATEFTRKLFRLIQNPDALVKLDGVQLTECAYFTMIYSHFHPVEPKELKETLINHCNQISTSLVALTNNQRIVHQWFMINAFFIQQFGEPLTFIETTLKAEWEKMPIQTTKSHFEDKVAQSLIRLGIKFERQKVIKGIPVDFYLPDYDLVLEVNGPRHYLYGLNNLVPTPRDIARNKLIGKVIEPISYVDWDRWEDKQCCDQEVFTLLEPYRQPESIINRPGT